MLDQKHIFRETGEPRNVVAHQTEPRYPRVVFHDSPQGCLRILRHAIRFVQDDDLVRRTWVLLPVRSDSFRAWCLTGEILDLLAYDGYSTFIRSI
jgi:hypothetical protein